MINNGFEYAINTDRGKRRKQQDKKDIKTDKFYSILNKYNKTLNEIDKNILTKAELTFITNYITNILKYPLNYYPNLM